MTRSPGRMFRPEGLRRISTPLGASARHRVVVGRASEEGPREDSGATSLFFQEATPVTAPHLVRRF